MVKKLGLNLGIVLLAILLVAGCQQQASNGNTSNNSNDKPSSTTEQGNEGTSSEKSELPFERIVVDSPAIAEYMSLYDVPLVGVPTTTKSMPEEYEDVTEIGIAVKPNMETIVSLNPDLFVGDQVLEHFTKQQMQDFDIKAVYLDNYSYESVFESIIELGELLGRKEVGELFIEEQRAMESDILQKAESLQGKKVAVIMGTAEAYQLATKNSYLGSILEKIGVENIANEVENTNQAYITFNKESLVASNPDYILALAHGGNPEQVEQSFKEEFASGIWDDTTAKRDEQIYYIDTGSFPVTGSIYNVQILEKVVNLLVKGELNEQ